VRIGRAEVRGSLDKQIIRRYLRRSLARIRYCYERELLRSPRLAGKVVLDFTIAATGTVSGAKARGLGSRQVERCIEEVIAGLQFPKSNGGGIVLVKYPITLKPDASAAWTRDARWLKASELLKRDPRTSVAAIAGLFQAPAKQSATALAWWLAQRELRGSTAPVAYITVAHLFALGRDTASARRVLSELLPHNHAAARDEFDKLGLKDDAQRADALSR
jgi:hypothetical protein